uniref:Zinc finger, CCHC-type n=1 Tax=Tanacetum cinerariifolium TaxID=118510 RepID=A0A6L2K224_TANCI|nr:zinc finger, CCHC-type [Tanacetum cinerariifolium]
MPNCGKFLKELISNKHKIEQIFAAFLSDESFAILQNKVPPKLRDPVSFLIPCNFNKTFSGNDLANLGASINLMPYSLYAKLSLETLKPTKISVRLADRSFQYPVGITKNMLIEVGKFTFPADFVILEMEEDSKFLSSWDDPFFTLLMQYRVKQKQLNLRVGTEGMIFNIDSAIKHSYSNHDTCLSIDVIDEILEEDFDALLDEGRKVLHSREGTVLEEEIFSEFDKFIAMASDENYDSESAEEEPKFEKITINTDYKINTSLEEPPTDLELKPLHDILEYVFLEEPFFPVIISSQLFAQNKSKLIYVLKNHKKAFAWKTTDIPGIYPSFCKHKLQLSDNKNPVVQKQRMLNPNMQEVIKKQIVKLLDIGIIYLIADSPWVSPIHCVPKKGGITIVTNKNDELVPTRTVTVLAKSVAVFMDDFFVFGNSFDKCLNNLHKILQRCKDAHLVLNWEKCHFMVKEGIVLGHKVFGVGLEFDKAKINVISKLPPPTNIKGSGPMAPDSNVIGGRSVLCVVKKFADVASLYPRHHTMAPIDFYDHKFTTKIEVSAIMMNGEYVKDMTSKFDKLAKFEGHDFRRWQKKMHFLLTTLKVVYVLSTPSLEMEPKIPTILRTKESSKVLMIANKKGTVTYWKCKKTGHMKKDCRSRKGNDGAGSNGSKDPEKQQVAWWVDSGATSYVCKDLRWFQVCKSVEDRSFVKMGNIATEPIKGIGRVSLTFTHGKTLCLDNVLYVPGIRKNLVSEIVLNKCGYKQVLESDKYIWSRHGSFVGFGYVCNELQRQDLIKVLRTDRGGGYYDPVYFQSTGIIHQTMAPYTPQQNGVAERKNMTLKEMVNSMLSYSRLSEGFWGEAIQKEGIDFFDTYAPVARIFIIRLLLALAAINDLVIHQMDVKTAFLNGDLDEEIYMKQPEGFVKPGHESKCVYSKFDASGTPVSKLEYSRAIRCLMYAMISTRPDIAFAVGKLSRYTSNPSALHWQALGRVFKYLKGTMDYGLTYSGYPSVIESYSNPSWINNMKDHSSTSGWVFLFGGGAISWASKKQTCITSSTIASEFVALAAAGNEAEWLRNLVYEIPLCSKPISTISIRCDSAATLAKAYSQVYNGKSKHLGVRHSMIRELIMNGVISMEFVRTQLNLADHLTKGLARDLVRKAAIGMGLKST